MTAQIDVRGKLTAELRRLTHDAAHWPLRDRRQFRNLLLDSVSSDAMPMVELLLTVHDDGRLRALPDSGASRALWDAADARLANELQSQRYLEPSVARFVAEAWVHALGPDAIPAVNVRRSTPARTVAAPLPTTRPTTTRSAQPSLSPPGVVSPSNAASIRAYKRANILIVGAAAIFALLIIGVFRSTARTVERSAQPMRPAALPVPEAMPDRTDSLVSARPENVSPSLPRELPFSVAREPVTIGEARARATDDVVLKTGRVIEGRVVTIRAQTVVIHDNLADLDFEVEKAEIERIVTSKGQVLRFSAENVPLISDDDMRTSRLNAGEFRVRYTARWGVERIECLDVAKRFAPGVRLTVRHVRGAPMLNLDFTRGAAYNAAVYADGSFESVAVAAQSLGPGGATVSSRLSGRFSRDGKLLGIVRLSALASSGEVVCDLALTMNAERVVTAP